MSIIDLSDISVLGIVSKYKVTYKVIIFEFVSSISTALKEKWVFWSTNYSAMYAGATTIMARFRFDFHSYKDISWSLWSLEQFSPFILE